jgi:hypothetical protein
MRSVKSKFEFKFLATPQDKPSLKDTVSTAVAGLRTILRTTEDAAGDAEIPGIQAGIGGLVVVLNIIKVSGSLRH